MPEQLLPTVSLCAGEGGVPYCLRLRYVPGRHWATIVHKHLALHTTAHAADETSTHGGAPGGGARRGTGTPEVDVHPDYNMSHGSTVDTHCLGPPGAFKWPGHFPQ